MLNETQQVDADVLRHLVQGKKTIVEIGTFIGGTAEVMACFMPEDAHLTTIDYYQYRPVVHWGNAEGKIFEINYTCGEVILLAVNRLDPHRKRVTQIIGESTKVAETFADHSIDMVFIDGAHDYDSVMADLNAWIPKVKPDGIISGHDYNLMERFVHPDYALEKSTSDRDGTLDIHFGVARALREVFEQFNHTGDRKCSMWWASPSDVRKPEKKKRKRVENVSETLE